jgi:hypothetical protein
MSHFIRQLKPHSKCLLIAEGIALTRLTDQIKASSPLRRTSLSV